jgi:hypothetical protein
MKQTRLTIVRITSNLAELMSATDPRDAGQYRYAGETLRKLVETKNEHTQITELSLRKSCGLNRSKKESE